jgi:hypothetical protein
MKKIILLLLALTLTACTIGAGTATDPNLSKWQDANITHYRFKLGVSCFCPVGGIMPMTVEVLDGEVVSIMDVNGISFTSADPMYDFVVKYATIDRLFAELNTDSVRAADKLTVTYDQTYGFPTEIAIDYIERAADDELYLSASGFEPLP